MAKDNIIVTKSYEFALEIVSLFSHLQQEKKEFILSKQILRSGTSIGANVEEATAAISKKEFIMKLQISYKEARETKYWLKLLRDSNILDENIANKTIENCDEVIRILNAIIQSTKN